MKVNIYSNYSKLIGSVETDGDNLKIHAAQKRRDKEIQGYVAHSAMDLNEKTGKFPTGEEVLKDMLRRMPDGKIVWCEEVK